MAHNTRSRFLILEAVPQLASYVLSRIGRRVSRDGQAEYGHPLYLLETFVERPRFTGACYRAANWQCVGQTKGRTRQDRPDGSRYQVPCKDIYLYALPRHCRQRLQGGGVEPSR